MTEMSSASLVELLHLLEGANIPVWLDGGWGVDALLQRQSRRHEDLDVVLAVSDVPMLRALLGKRGFAVARGKPPDSFVLANGSGLEVDVHAARFDEKGNGVYRMQNGEDWVYTADHLSGCGKIEELTVRCLTPEAQVFCHAHGYVPAEKDYHDMQLLEERFGVELPPQLQRRAP
jgi:lincosamide nucleotidyltransferase A/C/D/E